MSSPRNATHWNGRDRSQRQDFLDRLIDLCDALETAFEAHETASVTFQTTRTNFRNTCSEGTQAVLRKGSRTIWILNSRTTSTRSFPTVLLP